MTLSPQQIIILEQMGLITNLIFQRLTRAEDFPIPLLHAHLLANYNSNTIPLLRSRTISMTEALDRLDDLITLWNESDAIQLPDPLQNLDSIPNS